MIFTVVRNNSKAYDQSEKAEFELTASLLDAMTEAVKNTEGNFLFNESAKREKAYNTFFETLSTNLSFEATKEKYIKDFIPAIFYVDTDGFYVTYQCKMADNERDTITTPINTWVEEVNSGKQVIRYFLKDYVEVINRNPYGDEKSSYKGRVEDVYAEMSSSLRSHLSDYLSSYDKYCDKRSICVARRMEEETNFYVNTYNVNSQYTYELQIPHDKFLQYGRQLDRPSMFAFMQGKYIGMTGKDANIFAFAQSEVLDESEFVMERKLDGSKLYHRKGCPDITGTVFGHGNIHECGDNKCNPHTCVY